jgi:phosphoserine phosphatase
MQLVLTLIAAGPDRRLGPLAAAISQALATARQPVWLAADEACDVFVDIGEPDAVEKVARAYIGETRIDFVVQPAAGRRKRLLVADLESTIIENEMLDELADFVGLRDTVAEVTRRAMNGELDFVEALSARVALLRGLPTRVLDQAATRIRLTAGAAALVATMRAHGARAALVSGGFTVFAERVAAGLGFDTVVANRLELAGGRILGTVAPPIVTREVKSTTLATLARDYGLPLSQTLAVGDGANDLPMLAAAGLGIAFHAKPAVAAQSRVRLDYADLTGVLYAQGYRKADFAR